VSGRVEAYHHPVAKRDDWETPWPLFERYNAVHGFTLDACALPHNAKCARYYTPAVDGLVQDWANERVWLNPPYGRGIRDWMEKAYREASRNGALVVALVPARTDSGWWHDYVKPADVEFLRGRVKFVGAPYNAPFPCAVVVWRPMFKGRYIAPAEAA
jgi:phage N-6-adenine-methyltransferase